MTQRPLTVRSWLLGDDDGNYQRTSPALLAFRIRHRLTGVRRGCLCPRCFNHPRRRVSAREVFADRLRLVKLEERVRELERSIEES